MKEPSRAEKEAARVAAEVTRRAIRRLDVFEWVMFGAAFVLAVAGGRAVAWLVASPEGLDVRTTWIVSSLLLFVIPGCIVIIQTRRSESASPNDGSESPTDDG